MGEAIEDALACGAVDASPDEKNGAFCVTKTRFNLVQDALGYDFECRLWSIRGGCLDLGFANLRALDVERKFEKNRTFAAMTP